jgi:IS30 family transposase
MDSISQLDPIIQLTLEYLSDPKRSLQQMAVKLGISRQAVHKKIKLGVQYLQAFDAISVRAESSPLQAQINELRQQNQRLTNLVAELRRLLLIRAAQIHLLRWLREKVQKFIPHFKHTRFTPLQKSILIDLADKFQGAGGTLKVFCRTIGRSPETLLRWRVAHQKYGMAGLADKTTRPKNFGNKVPLWIKDYLVMLFIQFPAWTEHQYHSYIKCNPATRHYVCLPTIKKLKAIHTEKSEDEKSRIKKRWAFAPGVDVWTVDFTCILKTPTYKLQLLTVSDARSRFLFDSVLLLETSTEFVVNHLEDLFIKYGKPTIIKSDNGPEFKTEFRAQLQKLSVHLLNSPTYYGQFSGAHERIHRMLKTGISKFSEHHNITRLVDEINRMTDDYNYEIPLEYLGWKTPAEIFLTDTQFFPDNAERVTPYQKEGQLRMEYTSRTHTPARTTIDL